jgi:hypothetical protein
VKISKLKLKATHKPTKYRIKSKISHKLSRAGAFLIIIWLAAQMTTALASEVIATLIFAGAILDYAKGHFKGASAWESATVIQIAHAQERA